MIGIEEMFAEYANAECDEFLYQFASERRADVHKYDSMRDNPRRKRYWRCLKADPVRYAAHLTWKRIYSNKKPRVRGKQLRTDYKPERIESYRVAARERMRRLRATRKHALALESAKAPQT